MACSNDKESEFQSGYDLKTVDENKDLQCSICLNLVRDAMGTPCSHLFCSVCLQRLIGNVGTTSCLQRLIGNVGTKKETFACPVCRESVDTDKVHPIAFADRLVRGSNVYCSQKSKGCKWIGTLASFLEKHKQACPFQIIKCHYEGCKHSAMKRKIKAHFSKCKHRLVGCQYCESAVRASEIDVHHSTCEGYPTQCPQNECNVVVPKREIQVHLAENCEFIAIACSYAAFGCPEKVLRNQLDQHNEQAAKQHMAFMCKQMATYQSKIQSLESANAELRGDVKVLTQCCSDFELKRLFLKGVNKWILKNDEMPTEESYLMWYCKIFGKMAKNKLYHVDNAMFIKLINKEKKQIVWSSNNKVLYELTLEEDDIVYKGDDFFLRDVNGTLYIETKHLDTFKPNGARVVALHTIEAERITSFTGDSNYPDNSDWHIFGLTDQFYIMKEVILCLIKGQLSN